MQRLDPFEQPAVLVGTQVPISKVCRKAPVDLPLLDAGGVVPFHLVAELVLLLYNVSVGMEQIVGELILVTILPFRATNSANPFQKSSCIWSVAVRAVGSIRSLVQSFGFATTLKFGAGGDSPICHSSISRPKNRVPASDTSFGCRHVRFRVDWQGSLPAGATTIADGWNERQGHRYRRIP